MVLVLDILPNQRFIQFILTLFLFDAQPKDYAVLTLKHMKSLRITQKYFDGVKKIILKTIAASKSFSFTLTSLILSER